MHRVNALKGITHAQNSSSNRRKIAIESWLMSHAHTSLILSPGNERLSTHIRLWYTAIATM